jgi:ribosomal protein L37AE/L43A
MVAQAKSFMGPKLKGSNLHRLHRCCVMTGFTPNMIVFGISSTAVLIETHCTKRNGTRVHTRQQVPSFPTSNFQAVSRSATKLWCPQVCVVTFVRICMTVPNMSTATTTTTTTVRHLDSPITYYLLRITCHPCLGIDLAG